MLVLNRKLGEVIVIGDIKVFVCRLTGGAVRIGIEAPPDVKIQRGEFAGLVPPPPVPKPPKIRARQPGRRAPLAVAVAARLSDYDTPAIEPEPPVVVDPSLDWRFRPMVGNGGVA